MTETKTTNRKAAPVNGGGTARISLKNIKYSEFASHETHCFEATIYIDGKRAGTVWNSGSGGSNSYHPHSELWPALMAEAERMPSTTWMLDDQPVEMHPTPDEIIDDLLVSYLYSRDLKRAMATRILFVSKDGILKESKPFKKPQLEALLSNDDLPKMLGSETILNFMPPSLALQTYRTAIAAGA